MFINMHVDTFELVAAGVSSAMVLYVVIRVIRLIVYGSSYDNDS